MVSLEPAASPVTSSLQPPSWTPGLESCTLAARTMVSVGLTGSPPTTANSLHPRSWNHGFWRAHSWPINSSQDLGHRALSPASPTMISMGPKWMRSAAEASFWPFRLASKGLQLPLILHQSSLMDSRWSFGCALLRILPT